MKLLFFISSFQSGGAERVASILLERWRREGWDIVAAEWSLKDPFYALDPSIQLVRLGLNAEPRSPLDKVIAPLRRLASIRKTIRRESPDLVVSFMTRQNIYSIFAARFSRVPIIVCEHNKRFADIVSPSLDRVRALAYRRADKVTVLTARDHEEYPFLHNIAVMPNPLDLPPKPEERTRSRYVLAVGRLERQKGFDLLLAAFTSIPDRKRFKLLIVGEGCERPRLEAQIRRLGLENEVELLGRRNDVYDLYQEAAFLVLPSRYEGFGMVLVEAMAFGCPVVAFDCPCGPREIIRDGIDGLLVPDGDVPALAAAMERMMGDEALRGRLGKAGPAVRERFGIDKVAVMWKDLFDEVLASKKRKRIRDQ